MEGHYKLINHPLIFKRASGTSRGILVEKGSTFIVGSDIEERISSIGEISTIPKLSPDANMDFVSLTNQRILGTESNVLAPAVDFGVEMLQKAKVKNGTLDYFDTPFAKGERGIPINGLIWMGEKRYMREQIKDKIKEGFRCIKMKIGAIGFDEEISLIKSIREEFSVADIEIRVDANGGFTAEEAMHKLFALSKLDIHSIEQPIKQGQWEAMASLCESTPIPIALDEELIGIVKQQKQKMLEIIMPQYIILKPSLLGGWGAANEWIRMAESLKIGWWNTSALESNVGLHAIASWTDTLNNDMPQGLGTGGLFSNNIPSPLEVRNAQLWYDPNKKWDFSKM